MIIELKRSRAPLAMVDGGSASVLRRWMKAPRFVAALMNDFDLCLARSESDGTAAYRARRARGCWSPATFQFDATTLPADRRELAELAGLTSGRQIDRRLSARRRRRIAAAPQRRLREVFPTR